MLLGGVVEGHWKVLGSGHLEHWETISARPHARQLPEGLMVHPRPASWGAQPQRGHVGGLAVLFPRRLQVLQWRVQGCEEHLAVAVVALVVVAALLPLPNGGLPKVAMHHLGHRNPGILGLAVVVEEDEVRSAADPLAGGQSLGPIDSVAGVGHLLQTAGVALGDTVQEVAQAVGHGPCCERGYPSARLGAAAHRRRVQKEVLRPEVQQLLQDGHLLALPYQLWVV